MLKKNRTVISFLLILLGIICRILPHAWNFTPIIAISLFAGVYIGRSYAVILPLIILLFSDFLLGFYEWPLLTAVYSTYLVIGLSTVYIKKYKSFEMIFAGTIFSSVVFFIITNFAVWQFSSWYTNDLDGLIECYILAIPFFRNTLLGSIFYVALLFGTYELCVLYAKNVKWKLVVSKLKTF